MLMKCLESEVQNIFQNNDFYMDQFQQIAEKKLKSIFIDTLGTELRDELINTGKVTYTKHMSWDYLGHKNDHNKLIEIIKSCLNNDVENPVLERRVNKWF